MTDSSTKREARDFEAALLISARATVAEWHMAAVGFGGRCGGEPQQSFVTTPITRGIKHLSPLDPYERVADVTARLVLTLSEATDLMEARCQR